MNLICALISAFVVKVSANVDIFSKCPDFRPINGFDVEELYGKWFTLEMVTHYEGKRILMHPGVCVTVNLDSSKNSKSQDLSVNAIDLTIENIDKKNKIRNKIKYSLKVNVAKQGHWVDNDIRNFQVIMIDGNFTVITLCDKTRLISFVMAREQYTNVTLQLDMAHDLLMRRGFSMENVKTLCKGRSLSPVSVAALFALISISKCIQTIAIPENLSN